VTVIVYTYIFYKPQQGGHNITYNLSTEYSNSRETDCFSASPEIPHILWNPPLNDLATCTYAEPDQSRSEPHVPLLED
jgi:hypothetical protein